MNASVTVSVRTMVIALALTAAVLAAYFVGSAGSTSGPAAADAAGPESPAAAAEQRTPQIALTGTGEVAGVPDQLVFTATITESRSDVSSALSATGGSARRVLAALAEVGVDRDDVQTTGLSVRPQYRYEDGTSVLTGYGATERLSVVVRSLPDAGEAIGTAVDAGGNGVRISDVRLKIGDVDTLLTQAREAAVADAEEKAQAYADATGSELGSVISVREVSRSPQVEAPLAYRSLADEGAASTVPIRAGTEELTVKVAISWSLA